MSPQKNQNSYMKHFSRDMRPLQSWAPTSSVTLTRQLQEGHKKTLDVVLEIPKNYLVTLKIFFLEIADQFSANPLYQ